MISMRMATNNTAKKHHDEYQHVDNGDACHCGCDGTVEEGLGYREYRPVTVAGYMYPAAMRASRRSQHMDLGPFRDTETARSSL